MLKMKSKKHGNKYIYYNHNGNKMYFVVLCLINHSLTI